MWCNQQSAWWCNALQLPLWKILWNLSVSRDKPLYGLAYPDPPQRRGVSGQALVGSASQRLCSQICDQVSCIPGNKATTVPPPPFPSCIQWMGTVVLCRWRTSLRRRSRTMSPCWELRLASKWPSWRNGGTRTIPQYRATGTHSWISEVYHSSFITTIICKVWPCCSRHHLLPASEVYRPCITTIIIHVL